MLKLSTSTCFKFISLKSHTKKASVWLGVVAHTCDPSYKIGRKIVVQDSNGNPSQHSLEENRGKPFVYV
jgi:hypothetical protein